MKAETMEQKLQLAQALGDISSRTQYIGAAAAGILGFLNNNAAAIGAIVAILGFFLNWYYKHKSFRIEKTAEKE